MKTYQTHEPVLRKEVIAVFCQKNGCRIDRVIDGTVGTGGHSEALLNHCVTQLLGLDRDQAAITISENRLKKFMPRYQLKQSNYEYLDEVASSIGWYEVDGILLDLGYSSFQISSPDRGFSFQHDGPLDMRFNSKHGLTASEWLNTADEDEIANVLYLYGEERQSRSLAQAIVSERPLYTTLQLSQLVKRVKRPEKGRSNIHPATRVFQAIRIAINDELGSLKRALPKAIRFLRSGGRLAVISFHSIEDRIVKSFFREASKDCLCPPEKIVCDCGHVASVKLLTRKPIKAKTEEISLNPRSRSAHMRVVETL